MYEQIINNIPDAYITQSNIHKKGLFATDKILAGSCLGYLDGQHMSWERYQDMVKKIGDNSEVATLFLEWNALTENELLVRPFRTKYSFINHSRTPNVAIRYNPIRLITLRDILPNEELTLDYRKEPLNKEYLNGHGKTYL